MADFDTKSYMCALVKCIINGHTTHKRYGQSTRNKLTKSGLSELSILRFFSYHGEENGIEPKDLAKDCFDFLTQFPKDQFILRKDDRWSFLPQSLSEYKTPDGGEKHFICNDCYEMKPIAEKGKSEHRCGICRNKSAMDSYHKNKDKPKAPKVEPEVVVEVEKKEVPFTDEEVAYLQEVLYVPVLEEAEPKKIAEVEEITGGKGSVLLTLSVEVSDLATLLNYLEPILKQKED